MICGYAHDKNLETEILINIICVITFYVKEKNVPSH